MEKFYLYVAVPASLILLIQTFMTVFGLTGEIDVDFDGDGDVDVSGETGLTIFSIRNMVAFFTFFGWSGLWMMSSGFNSILTVIVSILIGIIFMVISMSLFFLVSKMQRSGNIDLKNAVGKMAEVYIPIPAKRRHYGKVMIVIQGSLTELEAVTDDAEDIVTGSQVEVVKIEDNSKLVVRKTNNI